MQVSTSNLRKNDSSLFYETYAQYKKEDVDTDREYDWVTAYFINNLWRGENYHQII